MPSRARPPQTVLRRSLLGEARPAGPGGVAHSRSRGSAVIPLDAAGKAQVEEMLGLAEDRGVELPPGFELDAVQVFYGPELRIDEVRLAGFDDAGRPWQAAGRAPLLEWLEGEPHLLQADRGRRHFSAVLLEGEPAMLALLWDVTGMWEEPEGGEPYLRTGSSSLFHAVRHGVACAAFERSDGHPWPRVGIHTRLLEGEILLLSTPGEPEVRGADVGEPERALAEGRSFGDLDADVLDALADLWIARARHEDATISVGVDEILLLRGLQPKRNASGHGAGYHPSQRRKVAESLHRLARLWVEVTRVVGARRAEGKAPRRLRGAVLEEVEFVARDADGEPLPGGAGLIYRPGRLLGRLLGRRGRQVAHLSPRVLAYDPYRRWREKRLARYLCWQWRIRASKGTYLRPFRVETLLGATGAGLDRRHPAAAREALETALDRLLADRLILAWQYERWREPRIRGWWRSWLEAMVVIEPPGEVIEAYRSLSASGRRTGAGEGARGRRASGVRARSGALPGGKSRLGERLEARRRELGLSQLQLAEAAGVPRARLLAIEAGRRPSATDRRRLEHWLRTDQD
ncbi:MAG: helix-turn-helix domain-containing protein [Holophagales bacterium]|nr:helix-turn-helix domain-containing protein [Holophagales bacterium]